MPQISQFGFSGYQQSPLEELGFSAMHRRDVSLGTTEIADVQGTFPDLSFSGDKIEEVNISKLRTGSLRVDEYMQSTGFVTGVSGWQITGDGDAEFASGTFRGTITATGGTIGGFEIGADYIRDVANSFGLASTVTGSDDVRTWWGSTFANRATAPARIYESGAAVFSSATVNDTTLGFQDLYGDGSDGTVTIPANTSITRDMFYDVLTVDATYLLNTNGFRVHVKTLLTLNGFIGRPGNAGTAGGNGGNGIATTVANSAGAAGTAGVGGAALADGSVKGAVAGTDGTAGGIGVTVANGNVLNGTSSTSSSSASSVAKSLTGSSGSVGGVGGNGGGCTTASQSRSGGTGAAVGSAGTTSGTIFNKPNTAFGAWLLQDFFPSVDALKSSAGSVGGSGGASGGVCALSGSQQRASSGGAGGAGGAGSAGGISAIYARKVVIGALGGFTVRGGAGGIGGNAGTSAAADAVAAASAGGSGGGAGGAGGPGGVLIFVYSSLTNGGSILYTGGTAGLGGTFSVGATSNNGGTSPAPTAASGVAGANGTDGLTGVYIPLVV